MDASNNDKYLFSGISLYLDFVILLIISKISFSVVNLNL